MKVSIQKKLILMYLFFYGGYVAFFPFLSTYAIKYGYTSSDIGTMGIFIALINFSSMFTTRYFSKKITLRKQMIRYLFFSIIFTSLFYFCAQKLRMVILAVVPVTFFDFSMFSLLDSYVIKASLSDSKIKYSDMRLVASITGMFGTALYGRCYYKCGISTMIYIHAILMMAAFLCAIRLPDDVNQKKEKILTDIVEEEKKDSLKRNKKIFGILFSGACIFIGWREILGFLPVMILDKGGSSQDVGVYNSVISMATMIAFAIYPILRRRFSIYQLMIFGAVTMGIRLILICIVSSVSMLITIQSLELFSYGFLQQSVMELIPIISAKNQILSVVTIWTGVQMALCSLLANGFTTLMLKKITLINIFFIIFVVEVLGTLFLIYTMNKLKKEKEYYGALQED